MTLRTTMWQAGIYSTGLQRHSVSIKTIQNTTWSMLGLRFMSKYDGAILTYW